MRIGSWCSIGVMTWASVASPAVAQIAPVPQIARIAQVTSSSEAPVRPTELHGIVRDEAGKPLSGAVVSALGANSVFAVSDAEGRFVFKNLAPGSYLVRAHLLNYQQSRGRFVQVVANTRTTSTIELVKGSQTADARPAVLEAGIGVAESSPPAAVEKEDERHGHDELAWRLRHLKRSVLKDAESAVADRGTDDTSLFGDSLTTVSRAVESSARLASALFSDLSLSGQINLLTSTSFDRPQDLFSQNGEAPRSVAYLALTTPGPSGDWRMRGTITQGDLASWILAGSYARHQPATHAYEAGVSYGMQRYLGGNGEALAAMRDGSRNVGSIYAMDNWTIGPRLSVAYGAEYSRYDYLADRGLFSPRVSVRLEPSPDDPLTIRATVLRRESAPGAEEFLPTSGGLWLPPERTFSQVSHAGFMPERHSQIEVSVNREWKGVLVGMRAFTERVEDQVVTLFGLSVGETPEEVGHYQVGSAGDFSARGWGVMVARTVGDHFRASVDYTQSQAVWHRSSPDADSLALLAASALRSQERIHDVTASIESVVAPTATRLLVIYKLNSAYSSSIATDGSPTPGIRFDVQISQALPFMNFTSARWEMLVAVSNLFKDELYDNSTYDELLVVRPPKRVVGGVTVRF